MLRPAGRGGDVRRGIVADRLNKFVRQPKEKPRPDSLRALGGLLGAHRLFVHLAHGSAPFSPI